MAGLFKLVQSGRPCPNPPAGRRLRHFKTLHLRGCIPGAEEDKQDVVSEERPLKLRERKKAVEKVSQEIGVSAEWLWDIEEEVCQTEMPGSLVHDLYHGRRACHPRFCVHGSDPQLIHLRRPLLKEESFKEIWNGGGYREFRRALKSDQHPFICRNCPAYSQGILT